MNGYQTCALLLGLYLLVGAGMILWNRFTGSDRKRQSGLWNSLSGSRSLFLRSWLLWKMFFDSYWPCSLPLGCWVVGCIGLSNVKNRITTPRMDGSLESVGYSLWDWQFCVDLSGYWGPPY